MDNKSTATPQEQAVETDRRHKTITIGLPAGACLAEKRFPLTPEATAMLVERGYKVKIQQGAANVIHYTDNAYARVGAQVTDRTDTLGCDIVIHLAPMPVNDINRMCRGAMLLGLLNERQRTAEEVKALLKRGITSIALDLIEDYSGNTPFADILAEVEGRGALTIAASRLANPDGGKGILLGGIAGVIPCEVTVIGSGIAARAAAQAAAGAGASVKIFDNDIYSLRRALRDLNGCAVGSALHPKVLDSALRSADVVIITHTSSPFSIDSNTAATMKRGVIVIDLSTSTANAYASGTIAPRTASMALSTTLLTLFDEIISTKDYSPAASLKLIPGLRKGVYTFMGKVVNPAIAAIAGVRNGDINIYLTLS